MIYYMNIHSTYSLNKRYVFSFLNRYRLREFKKFVKSEKLLLFINDFRVTQIII